MNPTYLGLAALGIPLLLAGLVVLRRNRPVLGFYIAAMAVGMGYLASTGALADIGRAVQSALGDGKPAMAPAAKPAK